MTNFEFVWVCKLVVNIVKFLCQDDERLEGIQPKPKLQGRRNRGGGGLWPPSRCRGGVNPPKTNPIRVRPSLRNADRVSLPRDETQSANPRENSISVT
jgi:hypothetical protein